MFAKISLESFTYEFTETLFFRNKKTREINNKCMIERVLPHGVLADTDSILRFFIFICRSESDRPDAKFRDALLEVICENETLQRFDTSHEF